LLQPLCGDRRPLFPAVACAAPSKIAIDGFGVRRLGATPATNALEQEADFAKLKEWLGHANIATTRIYDHQRHRMAKLKLTVKEIKPISAGYRRNDSTSSATPSVLGVDEIWGRQLWSKLQQLTHRGDSRGIALENPSATTGNGPAGPDLFG
jgi:hypothetical protein